MTKGEIYLFDTILTGPVILLLNQYFSYLVPELYVLYLCLVSSSQHFYYHITVSNTNLYCSVL